MSNVPVSSASNCCERGVPACTSFSEASGNFVSVSTAGSNNSGSRCPFTACQRIFAVASANFSSTRIVCVTLSATGASFGGNCTASGACADATPFHPTSPAISSDAVAAALPPPAFGVLAFGFLGAHHSFFSAGTATFQTKNAAMMARNAHAPFGQRSAAHASSVQPMIVHFDFPDSHASTHATSAKSGSHE